MLEGVRGYYSSCNLISMSKKIMISSRAEGVLCQEVEVKCYKKLRKSERISFLEEVDKQMTEKN